MEPDRATSSCHVIFIVNRKQLQQQQQPNPNTNPKRQVQSQAPPIVAAWLVHIELRLAEQQMLH